jgi:hypothetical protein
MPQSRIDKYFESLNHKTDLSNKYMPKELAYSMKNLRHEDLLWKLQKQNAKLGEMDSETGLDGVEEDRVGRGEGGEGWEDVGSGERGRARVGEEGKMGWFGKLKGCMGCADWFKKGGAEGARRWTGKDVVVMESKDEAGEE